MDMYKLTWILPQPKMNLDLLFENAELDHKYKIGESIVIKCNVAIECCVCFSPTEWRDGIIDAPHCSTECLGKTYADLIDLINC